MNSSFFLSLLLLSVCNNVWGKPRFLGILGPHHRLQPTTHLLHFFTQPGILQGVFFDDEELHKTKPVLCRHSFRSLFQPMVANTALLEVGNKKKKKVYALYEQEVPVELDIDFKQKQVKTVGRVKSAGVWSGHTKWNHGTLDTLRYSVFDKTVTVTVKSATLETLQEVSVSVKAIVGAATMTMVHDFARLDAERILFAVTPFVWSFRELSLKTDKNMQFVVVNMTSGEWVAYPVEGPSCLLFHFGNAYVDATTGNVVVHAAVYEDVDFMKPPDHLRGHYRQFVIDNRAVTVHRAAELEGLNLDFPVYMEPMGPRSLVCLRKVHTVDNSRNNSNNSNNSRNNNNSPLFDTLIVLRGIDVIREFHFPGRFLCSEPAFDPQTNHLYGLSWNVENPSRAYFWRLAWPSGELHEWPLETGGEPLYHGFHSGLFSG